MQTIYKVAINESFFELQADQETRDMKIVPCNGVRKADLVALYKAQFAWCDAGFPEVPPAAPMQWAGLAFGFARWLEKNYPKYRLEYVGPEPSNEPTPPGVSY